MQAQFRTIGVLRFSVLTPTYYAERFPTLEETAAHLFSDTRMELRFRLFERLCLPSLIAQTDPGFAMVVMTAEALPAHWRERLEALLAPHAHIALRPVGTGKHYPMLRAAYGSVPLAGASHRIMFRLDDDDAVDRHFVARLKRQAAGLFHMGAPPPPTILAQNRGFYVRFRDDGAREVFDAIERAPLSTGVALVAPATCPDNPYRYVHRKFAQHYDCFSSISEPGWIRTIHGDNKSRPTVMGLSGRMTPEAMDAELRAHFGLDRAALEAL